MHRYLTLAALLLPAMTLTQESPTYAFRGVNVVPMSTEEVLEDQTVLVSGGRIEAVGPRTDVIVPTGAITIDAEGRYLMPGLTEMHGHVPGMEERQYLEDVLFLYVANGVTTVRGMQGQESHLELRAAIERGEVLGPRFITSGPALRGDSVDGPQDAAQQVRDQAAAGYDFIKMLRGVTRAEYDAAVEAAADVGTTIAGHVPEDVGVARALEVGQATIDHLDGYMQYLLPPEIDLSKVQPGFYGAHLLDLVDENRMNVAAANTRDAGVWIVPTQMLIEHIALTDPTTDEMVERPEMAYMPPDIVQGWAASKNRILGTIQSVPKGGERLLDVRKRLIRAMHEEGVGLLLGSDAPQIFSVPGFSLHQEARGIVEAGLSPYATLRTGTVAPAEFFGMPDEFGEIRAGLSADFILTEDNALDDVAAASRPLGVMLRGRWLDRDSLDEGLAEIAARHH